MKLLWQDKKLIEVTSCPLCFASQYADVIQRSDGLRVRECLNCGLGYISPRPNTEALLEYYSKDYFTGKKDFFSGKNYCKERDQAIAERSITGYREILNNVEIKGKNVLEVGCATGSLLMCLAELEPNKLVGIDIAEFPIKFGVEHYSLDLRVQSLNDARFSEEYFDVIVMTDVIEHVEYLNSFLDELKRILKPGGVVYLLTPNFESSKAVGKFWICLHKDFEHLQYFSRKSIDYLCAQNGLKVNKYWVNGIPIELDQYPNKIIYGLHYIRYPLVGLVNLVKKLYLKLIRLESRQLGHNINVVISKEF